MEYLAKKSFSFLQDFAFTSIKSDSPRRSQVFSPAPDLIP